MMFNLSETNQLRAFNDRCESLKSKGSERVELVEKKRKRTFSQNNYFYLIISYYGMQLGYTVDEVKEDIKNRICPDVFVYEKKGRTYTRSSADVNTKEMTIVIDRFKEYSITNAGLKLPDANEDEFLNWIEDESKKYVNRYVNYK